MTIDPAIDITVIICTRNRAESLHETLGCLARADRTGLRCEVIVVDNASTDATAAVVEEANGSLPVRYAFEPAIGKSHALTRGVSAAPLGRVIAILDDDMSPHPDWFQGVHGICQRRPECDLFTGRSYVIWPREDVPKWCHDPQLHNWVYSVMDVRSERRLEAGRWFSGNHYWFRSRMLLDGWPLTPVDIDSRTYLWGGDARLMLALVERGALGVAAPDAQCGHRIQESLLAPASVEKRAARVGQDFAIAYLFPPKRAIKHSRLFQEHPLVARAYCLACLMAWTVRLAIAQLRLSWERRLVSRVLALERWHRYREFLRIAGLLDAYRLFRRPPANSR
jgi:glycosyltransferase involved in cell wall biosynthesis